MTKVRRPRSKRWASYSRSRTEYYTYCAVCDWKTSKKNQQVFRLRPQSHRYALPDLSWRGVRFAFVFSISRRTRSEQHRCEMIVSAMSIAIQRVAHQTHCRSPESRSLASTEGNQLREKASMHRVHAAYRVQCESIKRFVAEFNCPWLRWHFLRKVILVQDDVGPFVAVQIVDRTLPRSKVSKLSHPYLLERFNLRQYR